MQYITFMIRVETLLNRIARGVLALIRHKHILLEVRVRRKHETLCENTILINNKLKDGNMMRRNYFYIILLIAFTITGCKDKIAVNEVSKSSSTAATIEKDEFVIPKNEEIDEIKEETTEELFEFYEFDIDIGDEIHKFRVVMEAKPFEKYVDDILFDSELIIKVYDINDLTVPVQELKNKTNGKLFFENEILDANFDGYYDFRYLAYRGASNASSNFFLWDKDRLCFKFSEELSELSLPSFDSNLKVVSEFNKSGASSHYTRLYRYSDDDLICVRALCMLPSDKERIGFFSVQDLIDDELVEVLCINVTDENMEEIYDEYVLWMNLEFTGK